jgi:hypothetical protein
MACRPIAVALLSASLWACSASRTPELPALPAQAGGWTRTALDHGSPGEPPQLARTLGARSWAHAVYESAGRRADVRAFVFPAEASAFEAQQKWRRGEGVTTFYQGPYFAVCESPGLTAAELTAFARGLESAWLPPPPR